ncbi:hypothetical protein Bca101_060504 [Brassica carinata]
MNSIGTNLFVGSYHDCEFDWSSLAQFCSRYSSFCVSMGDSEDAQPPLKKRVALKELSRDNLVSMMMKTTLLHSRVVPSRLLVRMCWLPEESSRVKRRDPSTAPPPVPSSNPFAGIRFAAPDVVTNKPLTGSNSTPAGEGKHDERRSDGVQNDNSEKVITGEAKYETKTTTQVQDAAGEETEKANDDNDNSNSDKGSDCGLAKSEAVNGGEKTAKDETKTTIEVDVDVAGKRRKRLKIIRGVIVVLIRMRKKEKKVKERKTLITVEPLPSTSIQLAKTHSQDLPVQASHFILPNNGTSSVFGTSGSASAFPSKEEVSVETGEENERAAFTTDSVMFEYLQGWKERGKGEVKINVSTDIRKARLVMRSKGNYRLILNTSIYPEMKLASMDKKGITFAYVNSISEVKNSLSTFALKFKDPTIVQKLRGSY